MRFFAIPRIIKVDVGVLITLDITEKANLIIVSFDIKRKENEGDVFFFIESKQHKAREPLMTLEILHRGYTWHEYPCP